MRRAEWRRAVSAMWWNCNGWSAGKVDILHEYLDQEQHPPHALVLIETKRFLQGNIVPGFTTRAEW